MTEKSNDVGAGGWVVVTMRPEWAGTSTPLTAPTPPGPATASQISDKETDPTRLLPGHGSCQSLLEEGAPQDSCSRPALVVSVPTPRWPGTGPPLAPGHLSLEEAAPPPGHLLGKQQLLPVPLATRRLTWSLAAQSLLQGQHRPKRPPGSPWI